MIICKLYMSKLILNEFCKLEMSNVYLHGKNINCKQKCQKNIVNSECQKFKL